MSIERCDVVVVGARCGGASAAALLARAGRKVVVLERMRFGTDQLSTHLMFTTGVSILRRVGALEEILALKPTRQRYVKLTVDGDVRVHVPWEAHDGIDYCLCVPRTQQDLALVRAAQRAGADVRERWEVLDVLWRGGRACGVIARAPDGREHRIEAKLVVGADGRRSTVAARVGAARPYRLSKNGRGLVFRYMDDPAFGTKDGITTSQHIDGDSFGFCFPSVPEGKAVVLIMDDAEQTALARRDPERWWAGRIALHPDLEARFGGATGSRLRSTGETSAYFRVSSGPGWALVGDAGHFKDPIVGQGMSDALKMGTSLADAVEPLLDDPAAVDLATRAWEAARDRDCLPIYHFSNNETIVRPASPVLREAVRGMIDRPDVSNMFDRHRTPQEILGLPQLAGALARAVVKHGPRPAMLREAQGDLLTDLRVRASLRADRFRDTRSVAGSEHPGGVTPATPGRARELAEVGG